MQRLLLAALGIALATPALAAKDVTRAVIEQTQLDEQVAAACLQYCQGNRRRGWLERVLVEPLGGDLYRVQAEASLKNHQFTPAPLGLEGGFGFKHVIRVVAQGHLDASTCRLQVERVHVENDKYGLGNLARSEEGKVYRIRDCRRFL